MEQLRQIEELNVEVIKNLPVDDMNKYCQLVSKDINNICNETVYRDQQKKYGIYNLPFEDTRLPYDEPDPFRRAILEQAIYGSSLLGAELVHPNYACVQAIRENNMNVYNKFIPFVNDIEIIGYWAAQYRRFDLFKPLYKIKPSVITYWFDIVLVAQEEITLFEEQLGQLTVVTKLNEILPVLEPNLIENILLYGIKFYGVGVINFLEQVQNLSPYEYPDGIFDFFTPMNKLYYAYRTGDKDMITELLLQYELFVKEFFDQVTWEQFELIMEDGPSYYHLHLAWSWNRWDFYRKLIIMDPELIESNNLKSVMYNPDSLSRLTLEIIYAISGTKYIGRNFNPDDNGYLPYIKFCLTKGIKVNPEPVRTWALLDYAIKDPNRDKSLKLKLVDEDDKDSWWYFPKSFMSSQNTLPKAFYVSSEPEGRILQLAAINAPQLHLKYFGHNISQDSTPLAQLIYPNNYTTKEIVETAQVYDNYMAVYNEEGLEDVPKGEIYYSNSDYERLENDVVKKQGRNVVLMEMFEKDLKQRGYKYAVRKYKIKSNIKFLLARDVIQQKNEIELEQLYKKIPDAQAFYLIPIAAQYLETLFTVKSGFFSNKSLNGLVPAAMALGFSKPMNYLTEFLKWLKRVDFVAEPAYEYFEIYYSSICLVGLVFLQKLYTPRQITSILQYMLNSDKVPAQTKQFISTYLSN